MAQFITTIYTNNTFEHRITVFENFVPAYTLFLATLPTRLPNNTPFTIEMYFDEKENEYKASFDDYGFSIYLPDNPGYRRDYSDIYIGTISFSSEIGSYCTAYFDDVYVIYNNNKNNEQGNDNSQ